MAVSRFYGDVLGSLAAILCAGAIALAATSADAQGRRDGCDDYAREAVEQAEQNRKRDCGYEGPRWNNNRQAHLAWCLLSPRAAEQELEARRALLRECRSDRRSDRQAEREGKRANCDTYAKLAEVQADANDKYRCGYRGGEWSKDSRDHFRWCMRARRDYLQDELRYRTIELQKCFNKLGDYDDEDGDRSYKRRRF